jgi:hypothetical protein
MTTVLPADFPRSFPMEAVPGVQAKLLARQIDGQYIVGWTEDELLERHAYCEDLVQQLVEYCLRKKRENPDWTHEFNLERVAKALTQKARTGEWDITVEEQGWMSARIKALLGW